MIRKGKFIIAYQPFSFGSWEALLTVRQEDRNFPNGQELPEWEVVSRSTKITNITTGLSFLSNFCKESQEIRLHSLATIYSDHTVVWQIFLQKNNTETCCSLQTFHKRRRRARASNLFTFFIYIVTQTIQNALSEIIIKPQVSLTIILRFRLS